MAAKIHQLRKQLSKGGNVIELSLASNQYNTQSTYLKLVEIADAYSKENPGVKVHISILNEYESTMKIRRASNDFPDIFKTHGWSVARYAEHLEPLQNQDWAKVSP